MSDDIGREQPEDGVIFFGGEPPLLHITDTGGIYVRGVFIVRSKALQEALDEWAHQVRWDAEQWIVAQRAAGPTQ